MGLSLCEQCNYKHLLKWKRETDHPDNYEDATMLSLKMELGTMSEGIKATLESYNGQRNRVCPRPTEKTPGHALNLLQYEPFQTCDLQKY